MKSFKAFNEAVANKKQADAIAQAKLDRKSALKVKSVKYRKENSEIGDPNSSAPEANMSEAKVDKGRSDYGKASIRNYRRMGPGHGDPGMFDPSGKRGKTIDKRRAEHEARRGVKGAKVPAYKREEVEMEGTAYGLYKGSGKASGVMKKYLDAKAKKLEAEKKKKKPEYRNNPAFGDPSHHSNRKNIKEFVGTTLAGTAGAATAKKGDKIRKAIGSGAGYAVGAKAGRVAGGEIGKAVGKATVPVVGGMVGKTVGKAIGGTAGAVAGAVTGNKLAGTSKKKVKEEVEQINELSSATLKSYIKKRREKIARGKQGLERAIDQSVEKDVIGRTVKKPKGTYDIKKYKGKKGTVEYQKEEVELTEAPGIGTAITQGSKQAGKWAVRQGIKVGGKQGGYAVKKAGKYAATAAKETAVEYGKGALKGAKDRASKAGERHAKNLSLPSRETTNEGLATAGGLTYKKSEKPGKFEKAGRVVGGVTGSIAGGIGGSAAAGAAGSVVPVAGTAAGGIAGGIAGSVAGDVAGTRTGGSIGQKIDKITGGNKKPVAKKTTAVTKESRDIADILARLEKKRISKGGDAKDSPLPAFRKYHADKDKKKKEVKEQAAPDKMDQKLRSRDFNRSVSKGISGAIKMGMNRHKDAVEKKKVADRKAVPYQAMAASHVPEGEELSELKNSTLLSYSQKATNDLAFSGDGKKKAIKRAKGIKAATGKLAIRATDPDGSLGFNKNPKNEEVALGEEGYDRMRDDKLVKYGIGYDDGRPRPSSGGGKHSGNDKMTKRKNSDKALDSVVSDLKKKYGDNAVLVSKRRYKGGKRVK